MCKELFGAEKLFGTKKLNVQRNYLEHKKLIKNHRLTVRNNGGKNVIFFQLSIG
jgi:hypothetical protein